MPAGWLPPLSLVLQVTLGLPVPLGLGVVTGIFPHQCQVKGCSRPPSWHTLASPGPEIQPWHKGASSAVFPPSQWWGPGFRISHRRLFLRGEASPTFSAPYWLLRCCSGVLFRWALGFPSASCLSQQFLRLCSWESHIQEVLAYLLPVDQQQAKIISLSVAFWRPSQW